jgi:Flp pilus assembly pilin Flp
MIENRWSIIDHKLSNVMINNADELKNAIQTAWSNISNDTMRKMFESRAGRIR